MRFKTNYVNTSTAYSHLSYANSWRWLKVIPRIHELSPQEFCLRVHELRNSFVGVVHMLDVYWSSSTTDVTLGNKSMTWIPGLALILPHNYLLVAVHCHLYFLTPSSLAKVDGRLFLLCSQAPNHFRRSISWHVRRCPYRFLTFHSFSILLLQV